MHVHRGLDLPDGLPRSIRSQEAHDVGIFRFRTLDDDAVGDAQLLAAAIQREHAESYGICKCGVPLHIHAHIRVSSSFDH